jgi:hypothetical protein
MAPHPTPTPPSAAIPLAGYAAGYAPRPAGTYGYGPAAARRAAAPERAAPPPVSEPVSPAALHALLDALRSERKLLGDLAATMRRQRTAVGRDDLEGVDDAVFATHRILATLGQARLRRRAVNRIVVGVEDLPVRALDDVLGGQMTDELREARDGLQAAASELAREVDANRRVLREALAAGDAHARVLSGAGASIDSPMAAAAARALLDRTA